MLIVWEKILKKTPTFFVPVTREVKKNDKNEEYITIAISCKLQFIDSARFMASSLSNLFDKLAEGICTIKCKYRQDKKNAKRVELNIKIVSAALNTQTFKI